MRNKLFRCLSSLILRIGLRKCGLGLASQSQVPVFDICILPIQISFGVGAATL